MESVGFEEQFGDAVVEVGEVDTGFDPVADGTFAQGVGAEFGVGDGAEHHDGDLVGGGLGLEAAEDFKAVHLGHHDVEDDQVGRGGGDLLEGVFTAGGVLADVAAVLEESGHGAAEIEVVVYDQNRLKLLLAWVGLVRHAGIRTGVQVGVHVRRDLRIDQGLDFCSLYFASVWLTNSRPVRASSKVTRMVKSPCAGGLSKGQGKAKV